MAHVESKGWSSPGDDIYIPNVSVLQETLVPGMYEPGVSQQLGFYLKKIKFSEQNIILLPNSTSADVVKDIQNFWAREAMFRKYKFPYKRGMLMYGKPGGGKSSAITLICQEVIASGGYVLKFTSYNVFLPALRLLKKLHPNCRVVVLMEDIDQILYHEPISQILNLLDGVEASVNNVVWLATTNHPEKLDSNIKNRPSRFDRRFEFKNPDYDARLAYLTSLFKTEDIKEFDLNQWATDTEEFSFAHLKELFISAVIFGNPYQEALQELKAMGVFITADEM